MEPLRLTYKGTAAFRLVLAALLPLVVANLVRVAFQEEASWVGVLLLCLYAAVILGGAAWLALAAVWWVELDDDGVNVRTTLGTRLHRWRDILQVRPHGFSDIEFQTGRRSRFVLHLHGFDHEVREAVAQRLELRWTAKTWEKELQIGPLAHVRIAVGVVFFLGAMFLTFWPLLRLSPIFAKLKSWLHLP